MVVVEERDAAAGGLKQIPVPVFAAEDRLGIQAGFSPHVDEGDSKIVARRRNFFRGFRFLRCRRLKSRWARRCEDTLERKYERNPA